MKCPNCGAETFAESSYCQFCGHSLEPSYKLIPPLSKRTRLPLLAIGLLAVVAAAILLAVALLLPLGEENGNPNNQSNAATLIVTMINPFHVGASPCNYTLYINGHLESNGTILSGKSGVFEKNFSWSGSNLTILIHVEVQGSGTQPEDRTTILTPGATERVNIVLVTS